jgi:hypothetical protein
VTPDAEVDVVVASDAACFDRDGATGTDQIALLVVALDD